MVCFFHILLISPLALVRYVVQSSSSFFLNRRIFVIITVSQPFDLLHHFQLRYNCASLNHEPMPHFSLFFITASQFLISFGTCISTRRTFSPRKKIPPQCTMMSVVSLTKFLLRGWVLYHLLAFASPVQQTKPEPGAAEQHLVLLQLWRHHARVAARIRTVARGTVQLDTYGLPSRGRCPLYFCICS